MNPDDFKNADLEAVTGELEVVKTELSKRNKLLERLQDLLGVAANTGFHTYDGLGTEIEARVTKLVARAGLAELPAEELANGEGEKLAEEALFYG